jgi:uncharacterized protein (TIGR02646 family)
MIKLVDRAVSTATVAKLSEYQAEIDALPDYAKQVQKAQALWKNRRNTSVQPFAEIEKTLISLSPATRRCCYCEDARGEDVEHFHPKNLYPQLTFAWSNYLLACSACNSTAKRDQFAVFDSNGVFCDVTRRDKTVVPPIQGDVILINPRYEDPLNFLRIDLLTFHFRPRLDLSVRDQARANYTIEVLKLNTRAELVAWRKLAFRTFVGWVDTYRRYSQHTKENATRLTEHLGELKKYNHLAVWEEMKRTYRERNLTRWETLKTKYPRLDELDRLFTEFPQLLTISH